MVDHRASPGLTEEQARALGYDPHQCREGKLFEMATLWCVHCGSTYLKNLDRTRDRGHCFQCNDYICDHCDAARRSPDYIHTNIYQQRDLLAAGWGMSGSTHKPILTPRKLLGI